MLTVLFLSVIGMLAGTLVLLSDASGRVARRGAAKVQSTALAEAGVHALYARMNRTLVDVTAYAPTRDGELSVTALVAAGTGAAGVPIDTDGTYSARVVSATSQDVDVAAAGVKASVRTRTKYVLEGRGVAPNGGPESVVRASFTAISERAAVQTAEGTAGLEGGGALQSNAGVRLLTDGGLKLRDPSAPLRTQAGIVANGGVAWQTASRDRSSVTESDALDISQGQIQVPARPHPAYDATVGTAGLGNANGTTNYRTAAGGGAVSGLLGTVTGTGQGVTATAGVRRFPEAAQVARWQESWVASAKQGSSTLTPVTRASDLPLTGGERRMTAPAYIDGGVSLSGSDAVYLQPASGQGRPNVIYVRGDVTLSDAARLYNRGVLLVIEGKYRDASENALYGLLGTGGPYALDTAGLYRAAGLAVLAAVPDAVTINTAAAAPCGLVYAASGGVTVRGNGEARGVLVAGGLGERGGLSLEPRNGGAFTLWYRPEAVEGRTDLKLNLTAAGTVTVPFTASRLSEWVQVK
jgi:hypothetical protein